jgi:hypothetical protein
MVFSVRDVLQGSLVVMVCAQRISKQLRSKLTAGRVSATVSRLKLSILILYLQESISGSVATDNYTQNKELVIKLLNY